MPTGKLIRELRANAAEALVGVLVQVPPGLSTSVVLLHPLRLIFRRALEGQIVNTLGAIPAPIGPFFVFSVGDVEASLSILREEFSLLGYSAIAHVGRALPEPDGWVCLYGQPDQVRDFDTILDAADFEVSEYARISSVHAAAHKQ
jgi:hypothetical protein